MKFLQKYLQSSKLSLAKILLVLLLLFTVPFSAYAWVDGAALAQRILFNALQAARDALARFPTMQLYLKEYVLDPAVRVLAVQAEQVVQRQIHNFVASGGLSGSPLFASNPHSIILGRARETLNIFEDQLLVQANLCLPYRALAARSARNRANNEEEEEQNDDAHVTKATDCKLDGLVPSGVVENYLAPGGFTDGGWAPFLQSLQRPADNPIGIKDTVETKISQARNKTLKSFEKEALQGSGFLDLKECLSDLETAGVNCKQYITLSPGKVFGDSSGKAVNQTLDDLTSTDEFSEFIGMLLTQYTTDALTFDKGILR